MRAYAAILRTRALTLFQYRAAAFAGLSTQIFWGILKVMVLTAFYTQANAAQPLTLEQAVTYIWLGQALLQLLPWSIDRELEALVKKGNVAYELIRPVDLYGLWFARALAMRVVPTSMRCGLVFLFAGVFFGLKAPVSWSAGGLFVLSVGGAALLASAITTIIIISLFWTLSGEGTQRLWPSVIWLFSGLGVPLPLFPDWMQPFLNLQPLRGVLDIPCRIYTGVIAVPDAGYYLCFQLVWFAVFVFVGRQMMEIAMKRVVIQGG